MNTDHLLHLTLRRMLADVTYPEARKGRPWVEARLRERDWTRAQRWQLAQKALAWARTTDATLAATLWKALGEEQTMEQRQPRHDVEYGGGRAELMKAVEETGRKHYYDFDRAMADADDDPEDRGTDPARPEPPSTPTDVRQDNERITTMATTVNDLETPQDEVMLPLSPAEEAKLRTVVASMRDQAEYYNAQNNTKRLDRAEKLYREGKVTCDLGGIYHVTGNQKDAEGKPKVYAIDKLCPCEDGQRSQSKWCAHLIATAIHRKMQAPLQNEPSLFDTRTADDRLAELPPQSPPDASGDTNAPQDDAQEPPEANAAYQALLEAPGSLETRMTPRRRLRLPLRSISAIIADLSRPIPQQCWGTIPAVPPTDKSRGRPAQDFLHWHTVATILDTYAPGWEGEITRVEKMGERQVRVWVEGKPVEKTVERIALTFRLTIHAAEGAFHQEDVGMEDEDKDEYGDAMTSAIATAFKRSAAKFGVGRHQGYDKDKTTAAFLDHIRGEKTKGLADLGKLLDELTLSREDTLSWLKTETGAARTDQIPLWAIRSLMQQLMTEEVA